jgi:hypothetical protein
MSINFENTSFQDFENIPGMDVTERANHFYDFLGLYGRLWPYELPIFERIGLMV